MRETVIIRSESEAFENFIKMLQDRHEENKKRVEKYTKEKRAN
jgi:ribosomal protein S17E